MQILKAFLGGRRRQISGSEMLGYQYSPKRYRIVGWWIMQTRDLVEKSEL
jgi:hypothetical protein